MAWQDRRDLPVKRCHHTRKERCKKLKGLKTFKNVEKFKKTFKIVIKNVIMA